jgi:hypothetical protein
MILAVHIEVLKDSEHDLTYKASVDQELEIDIIRAHSFIIRGIREEEVKEEQDGFSLIRSGILAPLEQELLQLVIGHDLVEKLHELSAT